MRTRLTNNLLSMQGGYNVFVDATLPIPQTVSVCDIETREEVMVETGKLIHCIRIGNKFLCSQKFYDELKNYFTANLKMTE